MNSRKLKPHNFGGPVARSWAGLGSNIGSPSYVGPVRPHPNLWFGSIGLGRSTPIVWQLYFQVYSKLVEIKYTYTLLYN